jgi:lipopolysaccharide transport system ATP-binding protein
VSTCEAAPALSVKNLTKRFKIPVDRSTTLKYRISHLRSASRYRNLLALDDVSFDVPQGQFLGIVGANGSGKSTLLKVLAKIYRPTTGTATINGRVSPFLELGVGFNPELTARENVMVNGAILGLDRSDLERRMDSMLEFADLTEFADQKLKNYSSGMQVRLAFTVSIQAHADILLMDEVLAVGDADFQAKCFDVFAGYRREGKTVVLVTHDLGAVDTYCDRAILFEKGKLVADGTATDVTGEYRRRVGEAHERHRATDGDENRWGSREVWFEKVTLRDRNGAEHHNFIADDPMHIAFDLKANADVDDLVVGLMLHRADGVLMAGTNTQIARMPLPPMKAGEKMHMVYELPALTLLGGSYRLTVGAHPSVHTHDYDHIEKGFTFVVTDTTTRIGLFELGGRWLVDGKVRV